MSQTIGEGKGRTCEVTFEVIFRFSGPRSGLGGSPFAVSSVPSALRLLPRSLHGTELCSCGAVSSFSHRSSRACCCCCSCCPVAVVVCCGWVAAAIQLRALTVVTLFVFFSTRTRHKRVVGPSVVPRTTAFRKIQLRRLNSVAATFSRLSSGITAVVLTRVQRHRETCMIFEFWSCSWLLSSVVVCR